MHWMICCLFHYIVNNILVQKRLPLELTHLSFVRIGQEMLMEEDYAEDEIESELAPIAVQIAYVQQVNKIHF